MEFKYIQKKNIAKFREAALHFEEHGKYTNYLPGTSGFLNYWKEQADRCLYGYHVGSDYISGYNYFYWNFTRIIKVHTYTDSSGIERTDREEGFPDLWDYDKFFFDYVEEAERNGSHAVVLKARGKGYSFKAASMCNRNYFLLKGSKSFVMAGKSDYLTEDGILSKAWEIMDFIDSNTAWAKRRQFVNKTDHKRASYQVNVDGVKVERGFKSEIIGISIKDDPDKGRGKRGKLIVFEEAGSFKNLLKVWQVARPSVEQGKKSFGLMLAMGTGGDESSDFMSLEELFYYPKGYNILSTANIWSEVPTGDCGFFVPIWANYEGFYDKKTGISDKNGALEYIQDQLAVLSNETKDAKAITRYKAENCITPEDASLRVTGTIFPITYLKQRLSQLLSSKKYKDSEHIGYFRYNENKLEWCYDSTLTPIYDFPLHDNKSDGAIVLYEHPIKDSNDEVRWGTYICGLDPYDDDESGTASLGSMFIMNILTGRIVAEYTGRPPTAKEYYENALRLIKYYNAICNYEQNKKGLFAYFEQKNATYLLADVPKILRDREISNFEGVGNKAKGTMATAAVNKFARELIKSWLLETAYGKEHSNIYELVQIALIKELIYWNPELNADRVSALGMLLILREDLVKFQHSPDKVIRTHPSQHKFFSKNIIRHTGT